MEGFLYLILFIVAVYFFSKAYKNAEKKQKYKEDRKRNQIKQDQHDSAINKIKGMLGHIDQKHLLLSVDYKSGLYFDESTNKINLFDFGKRSEILKYNVSDIIKIEVKENENTVIDSSSAGAAALVGSLVAGTTGAVVGGLAGGARHQQYIKNLSLNFIVNDIDMPSWNIDFLKTSQNENITKDSVEYKKASDKLNHWYGFLTVLMSREQNKQSTM